jgi:Cu/Zn superoxide dismutase
MLIGAAVPAAAGAGLFSKGSLSDLSTVASPTDGAWAVATATVVEDRTIVRFEVKDLVGASAGTTFGAHVHIGPCVAGNGAAALGHYNHGGGVSPDTEVWLDFTVTGGGTGHAVAIVPFAIPAGGAQSIVIHALPTAPDGTAGARLACLPLEF